jgi:hypothetical protein
MLSFIFCLKKEVIMGDKSKIKTVGDFRRVTSELSDDYTIDFRLRKRISNKEAARRRYPYPFDTVNLEGFEFDDVGVMDKQLCLGVEIPEQMLEKKIVGLPAGQRKLIEMAVRDIEGVIKKTEGLDARLYNVCGSLKSILEAANGG